MFRVQKCKFDDMLILELLGPNSPVLETPGLTRCQGSPKPLSARAPLEFDLENLDTFGKAPRQPAPLLDWTGAGPCASPNRLGKGERREIELELRRHT